MTEEVMGESPEIDTPATQAAPQGDAPQQPDPAPETQEADTAEQPDEDHKVPKGVQKRIDRLTRERYRLQGELEAMRRQMSPQPEARPAQAPSDDAPKPEQFQSYEQYLEAKAEWKAEQKVGELLRKQQETAKHASEQSERARMRQSWEQQVEAASDVYDDFEEVALAPDVPITEPMMQAILRTEKGADVAYYLGKHREEAARIAGMDPFAAAIAIGRIEATLARPQPKKTTSAPPPISPVGARASVSKDPDKMSTDEWLAWRQQQIKGRR